ncbi:MAG: DUF1853 family protein [Endozoicomonas sp.]
MNSPSTDQLSRDITWILFSPSLFGPTAADCFISQPLAGCPANSFNLSEKDAQDILWKLARRRSHLLGIYYETLWQHILQMHPDTQLLAHNLQVQSEQVTLGEFDLIYRQSQLADNHQPFYHRELAVKYYLGVPGIDSQNSPWRCWVGPGLRDRMDRKLNRMLNHQITLSDTDAGKQVLEHLGIEKVTQEVLIQGYLFYPTEGLCPEPEVANPEHLRGYWVAISQLESWLQERDSDETGELHFIRLPKLQWLSKFHRQETPDRVYTRQRLTAHLKVQLHSNPQPVLVSACLLQENIFSEAFRFFVVPDNWLENARKVAAI